MYKKQQTTLVGNVRIRETSSPVGMRSGLGQTFHHSPATMSAHARTPSSLLTALNEPARRHVVQTSRVGSNARHGGTSARRANTIFFSSSGQQHADRQLHGNDAMRANSVSVTDVVAQPAGRRQLAVLMSGGQQTYWCRR